MKSPEASIVVLAHNQLAYTEKCIESLVKGTTMAVEIVLVDNGSRDDTFGFFSRATYPLRPDQTIRVIRSKENLGFAGGNNLGIAAAAGQHIVLMNNDIVVPEAWLEPMMAILSSKPKAGIVGPMSNSVSGPQKVDRVSYNQSTLEGFSAYADAFGRRNRGKNRRVLRLVGFCMLIRREVIERIGGLDTLYGVGNFEDDDYCLRSAIAGFEAYIAQDCFVHHFGSRTFAGEKIDYRRSLNRNWEKYKEKWELPIDLPYGVPYRVDTVLRKRHAHQQIYCPLPAGAENESVLIVGAQQDQRNGSDPRPHATRNKQNGNISVIYYPIGEAGIDTLCLENLIRATPGPITLILSAPDLKRLPKKVKSLVLRHPGIQASVLDIDSRSLGFLNAALRLAPGELIAVVRGNSIVGPEWLQGLQCGWNREDEQGITGVIRQLIHSDEYKDKGLGADSDRLPARIEAFRIQYRHRRLRADKIDPCCFLLSKMAFEELGGFDESIGNLPGMVDDFTLRCEMTGYRPTIAGEVLVITVEGPDGVRDRLGTDRNTSAVINPSSSAGKGRALIAALRQAKDFERRGRVNQAVELLLKAIGKDPESVRPYILLARILLRSKRYGDALETLKEFPQGEVTEETLLMEGYALEGMGRLDDAENKAIAVLTRNDRCASAINLKGLVTFQRGAIDAAASLFREAIDRDPGFAEPYSNLGAIRLGQADHAEALALQEKAFLLSPDEPDIVNNYHALIVAMGAMERAEPLVRDATALYPMCRSLRHFLIDLLIQRQRLPEAMDEIEQAIVDFGLEDGILSAALKVRSRIGPMHVTAQSPSKKSVSLCMIIKNEEEYLARCLHSLKPIVTEMIVVDTGSSDRSRDIATAYGARVLDFAWVNDFSAARNYSMDQATGQWILIMDGDEVISPKDHAAFRRLVADRSVWPAAYLVTTRNYQRKTNTIGWMPNSGDYPAEEAGFGWIPTTKVRLVSNDRRLRFSYPVHEMLDPSLLAQKVTVRPCDIPVHHYGKLDEVRCQHKGEAYFELGMRKLDQMGDSEIALRELATEAGLLGHHEQAISLWRRFLALKPHSRFVLDAYVNMATAFGKLGNFNEAVWAAGQAVRLNPHMKEALYSLAYAELHRGNALTAVDILVPLVDRHPRFPPARFILAASLYCIGRVEEGDGELKTLLSMPMGRALAVAFYTLAKELKEAGRLEYATLLLRAAVENNHLNAEVLNLLSECLKTPEREIVPEGV